MTTVIIVAFTLLLYVGYKLALPRPLPGIPYNAEAANNLLGDIPSMIKKVSKTGDVVAWLRDQNLKTHSPISQIFIRPFGKPTLLVSDYREARDVLLHRIKDFDRTSLTAETFGGLLNRHQFTLKTGPEWKLHRRLVQDTMSPAFLNEVAAPSIYASSLRFVKLWDIKARLAKGRPFSATEDIFHVALDAVLAFSFGSKFPHSATKPQVQQLESVSADELVSDLAMDEPVNFPHAHIDEALKSMLELSDAMEHVKSAPSPRMKWWFVKKSPSFRRLMGVKNDCIRSEIEKAVEARNQNNLDKNQLWVNSAVDHIIEREERHAQKEGRKPDSFSPMVMDEVFGFVVAGHDTMSTTMCWGVKLLADHPTIQSRLRKSLQSAFATALSEKRLPSIHEISRTSVPYLEATMEEILRCGGTVPIGDREAIQDTVLLGHHIPKGTMVFFLHNGPSMLSPALEVDESKRSEHSREAKEQGQIRAWNDDDIALFKPERWLVEAQPHVNGNGNGSSEKTQTNSSSKTCGEAGVVFDSQAGPNIPFGLGIRACFGRRLAYVEFRIMLTMLIWNFELLECPEKLSGYSGCLAVVNKPQQCFVRLKKINYL